MSSVSNYEIIYGIIDFFEGKSTSYPDYEQIAHHLNIDSVFLRKIIQEWSGTTPERFFSYINPKFPLSLLSMQAKGLFDSEFNSKNSNFPGSVTISAEIIEMTPDEYRNKNLCINYVFAESPFGNVIIASTHKGICYLAFAENDVSALNQLISTYPNAHISHQNDNIFEEALSVFCGKEDMEKNITVHIKGTPFQYEVWKKVLEIPFGGIKSYRQIAVELNKPKAFRAVGKAIGENPVAFLIPCHRVIQQSGGLGGYRWNVSRKRAVIAWEALSLIKY